MCRTFWMNVCVKWAQNGVFFDIKRLNGAENAGIAIRRKILSDITDPNSVTELVITPDDPRWALPFNPQEAENMGWRQNEGWE